MTGCGLSERHALRVIGMSASAYRYEPGPDRNAALRGQIVSLAQRHRRYGSGMIYLKLRQAGERVNHKRVERLYAEAKLQVRRRKRKKVPAADRQPLGRPHAANQVWSMDFVFDRAAVPPFCHTRALVMGAGCAAPFYIALARDELGSATAISLEAANVLFGLAVAVVSVGCKEVAVG
jgi:transposase InsO family protein